MLDVHGNTLLTNRMGGLCGLFMLNADTNS